MKRRAFDLIAIVGGLALAIVLVVAGLVFQQNASFAKSNVRSQLVAQKITFTPLDKLTAEEKALPGMVQYAGQPLDDGAKAQAYAGYIGFHLDAVNNGKTYSETSTEARATPNDTVLAGKVQTLFRGETLRGLLLTSYAFWTLGIKAEQMSIVLFVGAGILILLSGLGLWHYRRTPASAEVGVAERHTAVAAA